MSRGPGETGQQPGAATSNTPTAEPTVPVIPIPPVTSVVVPAPVVVGDVATPPVAPAGPAPVVVAPTAPGAPVVPATPAPVQQPPVVEPLQPVVFSAEYVQQLRDEAARNRVIARDATQELESTRTVAQTNLAASEQRLAEAEARAGDLEAALTEELNRQMAEIPEAKRVIVAGSTVREKLNHIATLRAAGVLATELPRNPTLPSGGTRPSTPESPKTLAQWAAWPTQKAKDWKAANPEAYNALERAARQG